jgi:DNA polymerase III delta prime subunit
VLADILARLRKGKQSPADLRTALDNLDVEAAERKVAALEEKRRAVLLEGTNDDVAAIEKEIQSACLDVERTALARDEIARRLEQAIHAETEETRRARYEVARAQVGDAAALIKNQYVKAALQIARIIASVEEAERAAQAINADLPAGAAPLIGPECLARQKPGRPEEIVSTKAVERWVFESSGRIVPSEYERFINKNAKDVNKGVLRNVQPGASSESPVERRRFNEVRFNPHEVREWEDHLSKTVHLPGVEIGSPTFWPHVPGARPANASSGSARPVEVRHEPILDAPPAENRAAA